MLTLVLSVDFNLERLYRREHGEPREARPQATGLAAVLGRVYDAVYAPQDRLVEWFVERRLRGSAPGPSSGSPTTTAPRSPCSRTSASRRSSRCSASASPPARPTAYLWIAIGCGVALVPLELRRERRARA